MLGKLNILIINWRALKGKDPLAGGAEVATFEHAKRWVSRHNARVIWMCPPYKDNAENEIIDGVEFYYIGNKLTRDNFSLLFSYTYFCFLVFINYITHFRKFIDVVVDQAHGFPYLTPLYVRKKIILYIHEVAGVIWKEMYPFPISFLGIILEPLVFKPYKNITTVTGTISTKADLEKVGINSNNIQIICYGNTAPISTKPIKKEKFFTMLYSNRVVKMKRVDIAVEVFSLIVKKDKNAQLWIAGRGEDSYIDSLKNRCKELGILDNVKFWGYVSDETRDDLMGRAHVFINPSVKEGWGIVNIEANSQGTPAVVFNVPGSKESVVDNVSGYIIPEGDKELMATKILSIKGNSKEWYYSCIEYSKKFDWNYLSDEFYKLF